MTAGFLTPAFFGSRAYNDTISHPSLTVNIAQVYNQNYGRKLTNQEINWLKQGSVEEDKAPRWLNHFYNPHTGQGLVTKYLSAKRWARTQSFLQRYSWQDALDAYVEGDNQKAFLALGHVLHLTEDMTVPAHARLDAHPEGDPYEIWVKDSVGANINFSVSPVKIAGLDQYFDDLAFYSHDNFFSKDSIFVNGLKNKAINEFKLPNGKYRAYILGANNTKLVQVQFSLSEREYKLDEFVHSDYFSLLAPKAVSYGAGLIDLFIREAEAAKKQKEAEEKEKSWWERTRDVFSDISLQTFGLLATLDAPTDQKQDFNEELPMATDSGMKSDDFLPENLPAQKNDSQDEKPTQNTLPSWPFEEEEKEVFSGEQNEKEPDYSKPKQENNTQNQPLPNDGKPKNDQPKQIFSPGGGGGGSPGQQNQPEQPEQQTTEQNDENNDETDDENNNENNNESNDEDNDENNNNQESSEETLTAIETSIILAPDSPSSATFAIFEFSANITSATFKCQLDENDDEICASSKTYQNLAEGNHLFRVWAVDSENNQQDETPASHSWQIDSTGPEASDIEAKNITENSAQITFNTSERARFYINWGENQSYDNLTSQSNDFTVSHSWQFENLEPETVYYYQINTRDELGNTASSASQNFTTAKAAVNRLLVSEIQVSGETADDEWVELYNPAEQDLDISGWSIQYRGGESENYSKKNFIDGAMVPAKGFYLIANNGYQNAIEPDMTHDSFSFSGVGGTVFLVNNQEFLTASATFENVVDRLAYGAGSYLYPETAEFVPAPAAKQSLERKNSQNASAQSLNSGEDKYQGNAFDTDDNSVDFVLQANPCPQNSQSLPEPREENGINLSDTREVDSSTSAHLNYPKIFLVNQNQQEIIWQEHGLNLFGRERKNDAWSEDKTLISREETEGEILLRDSKITGWNEKILAFFLAEPAGQAKTLFLNEKTEAGWSVPTAVSLMNPSYGTGWDAQIDSAGNAHLTWQDNNDGEVKYQKCQLWPEISCLAVQGLNQLNVANLNLLLEGNNPHLVYWRVDNKDIRERYFSDEVWKDDWILSTNSSASNYARHKTIVDDVGDFHLVFAEEQGENFWNYYYLEKTADGWSAKEKIGEGLSRMDEINMAADTENIFALSNNQGESYKELNLWQKKDGAWSAPQKIAADGQAGDYEFADIKTDGSGKFYVIFKEKSGSSTKILFVDSV